MRDDLQDLLEHVLHAVMQPGTDALTLAARLRETVPDARATALLYALLSADQVIGDTFNGASPGRADAELARNFARTLAAALEEAEHEAGTGLRLSDLLI